MTSSTASSPNKLRKQWTMTAEEREEYLQIDETELLDELQDEDIEELAQFLDDIDPENNALPARDRTRYQNLKEPTGDYNRDKLMNYIDELADNYLEPDDYVPFTGEKKGKIWIAPEMPVEEEEEEPDEIRLEDESWEHAFETVTGDDLIDLASILGIHQMVDQTQYWAAQTAIKKGGYDDSQVSALIPHGVPCFSIPARFDPDAKNDTDVELTVQMVKDKDPNCTEVNFNNIPKIPKQLYSEFLEALKENTSVKSVNLANTGMDDLLAYALADVLEMNNTLECVNVESNYITGDGGLTRIVEMVEENLVLKELRLANQYQLAGQKCEIRMAEMLEANRTLQKFGYTFHMRGPCHRAMNAIKRNVEISRRVGRGDVEGDGTKERKPTPKVRDDLLLQLAEKKRQQITALRHKRIENEKEEQEEANKKRKRQPVYLTPDHVRRKQRVEGVPTGQEREEKEKDEDEKATEEDEAEKEEGKDGAEEGEDEEDDDEQSEKKAKTEDDDDEEEDEGEEKEKEENEDEDEEEDGEKESLDEKEKKAKDDDDDDEEGEDEEEDNEKEEAEEEEEEDEEDDEEESDEKDTNKTKTEDDDDDSSSKKKDENQDDDDEEEEDDEEDEEEEDEEEEDE